MKFNDLFEKLILETKQEFSLLNHQERLLKLFRDFIAEIPENNLTELIDDYRYDVSRAIYQALRLKPNDEYQTEIIASEHLQDFSNVITKNVQSYDDLSSNWCIFKYFIDPDFIAKKTYSKYITPDLTYSTADLTKLQNAIVKLKDYVKQLSLANNVNLALKFNVEFDQYFTENDNIKLYCFSKDDFHFLNEIENYFLSLLNSQNMRLYSTGIDQGFSFGEKLSRAIAVDSLNYCATCKSAEKTFDYLNINFEQLIKKYSEKLIETDF